VTAADAVLSDKDAVGRSLADTIEAVDGAIAQLASEPGSADE
jgi:hypothetical protein